MNNDIEWKMKKIGEVLRIGNGRDYKHLKSGNIPVYGTGGYMCSVSDYLYDGDTVCIGRKGTIDEPQFHSGKIWTVDTLFYTHSFDGVLPKYIYYAFCMIDWRSKNEATGVPSLSKGIIEKVYIPIPYKNGSPDLETQSLIAQKLGDMDSLIAAKEKLLSKKRNLKTAAMQKLIKDEESENWRKIKLGDITQVYSGGTPSTERKDYWNGDIPWMNSGELNLKIVTEVEGRITELGLKSSSTQWIPKECVLIGLAGQGKTRGTAAYNTIPLCTNQSIAAIYPNQKVFNSKFLYFYFDTQYEKLRELSSGGGGRGGLNKNHLLNYEIPIPYTNNNEPDIDKQKRIASILSDMDSEISSVEKELTKLQNLKTAMMQKMFSFKEVTE